MSAFDKDLKVDDIITVKSVKAAKGFFIVTRIERLFYQDWDTCMRTKHPNNPNPKQGDEYWSIIFAKRIATETGKPYKSKEKLRYSATVCTKQDEASIQAHRQESIERAERLYKHLLALIENTCTD